MSLLDPQKGWQLKLWFNWRRADRSRCDSLEDSGDSVFVITEAPITVGVIMDIDRHKTLRTVRSLFVNVKFSRDFTRSFELNVRVLTR